MDLAALIKQARYDARLTQQELARRVGRSRASIAQLEAGVRTPSFGSLEAILAALGKQLRMELEPLDEDVRRAFAAHAGDTSAADSLSMTVTLMEGLVDLEYRFEGIAAAALLGAPIALTDPIDLALPDGPEAVAWLAGLVRTGAAEVTPAGRRYPLDGVTSAEGVARLVELGEGGRFSLEIWLRTFSVRFAPAEDTRRAVLVAGEHGTLRAQPLHEIETTDRDTARVLRLLREQAQDARGEG